MSSGLRSDLVKKSGTGNPFSLGGVVATCTVAQERT